MHIGRKEDARPPAAPRNAFGRPVGMEERDCIQRILEATGLQMEERRAAYVFRSPRWGGQVVRLSARALRHSAYRTSAIHTMRRFADRPPLPLGWAGVHVVGFNGSYPQGVKLRAEHLDRLLK